MTAQVLPKSPPPGLAIDVSSEALESFVKSHVDFCAKPLGIVRPRDERQIEDLVRWANNHGVPLVPVSSAGGPRRRSDTAPAKPALVVELAAMNRLVHADGRDAIAIIEPGLTFPDFDEQLRPFGLRSLKPLLPRRNKSVLTTFLEREPVIAPRDHWDTSDPLASLSITFGSGETFRSGGASLPGTLQENLRRGNRQMMTLGPIGTDYTRLLLGSQGTFGIVSWASIYCEQIPAREEPFFYGADDYAVIAEFARLLALRQLGTHYFVLDRVQAATALGQTGGAFGSRGAAISAVPRWLLYVNITATDASPDACMAWQREDLAALATSVGARLVGDGDGFSPQSLASRLQDLPAMSYKDVPLGAHREVFCLSQLDHVNELVGAVEPLIAETADQTNNGVVPGVYVQPTVQGTSCHVEFTLHHQPKFSAEAKSLEQRMIQTLADAGGFISRPYADWSDVAFGRDPNIVPYLRKVKNIFDPKNLLNPNRLCF